MNISKIGENLHIHYGDGGEADMVWEIYVSHEIKKTMNMKLIAQLKKELITLGKERDDWRKGEPIQNIIDPDLFVIKRYEKDDYWLSDQHKKDFIGDPYSDEYLKEKEKKWKGLQRQDQKGHFKRRKYQWLATQFRESEKGEITIISPIHNLILSEHTKDCLLYQGIAHVFECMLPLFNKYPAFRDRKSKDFQVIVKSQRYEVVDMSGYNGHWHQEGLTENIIIGGLYYFEKDSDLIGGSLKFRNRRSPNEYYADSINDDLEYYKLKEPVPMEHEVPIHEGTALVFDNVELVHRVRMLKNKGGDQKKRYRSFLAFFIVDPEHPIESTMDHPSLNTDAFTRSLMKHTPFESMDIISLILQFMSRDLCTVEEAIKMRELNIESRKKPLTKGHWGECNFGNSGDQIWFKDGKLLQPGDDGESVYLSDVKWFSTTTTGMSTTTGTE